jgi:hypothetical protein
MTRSAMHSAVFVSSAAILLLFNGVDSGAQALLG